MYGADRWTWRTTGDDTDIVLDASRCIRIRIDAADIQLVADGRCDPHNRTGRIIGRGISAASRGCMGWTVRHGRCGAGVVPVQASLTAKQVKVMLMCSVGSNNENISKIFEGKSYSTYSYVRL